jgi:hypothetical protein
LLHAQISGFDARHTWIRRLSRQCADNGGRKTVVGLTVAVRVTRGRVGSRFGALFWCCGSPCPHIHTAASSVSFPSTVCEDAPLATSEILIYRRIQATLLKNVNLIFVNAPRLFRQSRRNRGRITTNLMEASTLLGRPSHTQQLNNVICAPRL